MFKVGRTDNRTLESFGDGDQTLGLSCSKLLEISRGKDSMIAISAETQAGHLVLSPTFRRAPSESESVALAQLLVLLQDFFVPLEETDPLLWSPAPTRTFLVASFYATLLPSPPPISYFSRIWSAPVPHNVRAFSWTLTRDTMLARDKGFNNSLFECPLLLPS
ncbi:hypothetical protein AMTR_s00070p00034470 [Amborella trichopoda]|uniref:Reverse transcriptase zinc-binding domain-containing protein n=1 Tax=Amborella trichopoda TaxID=13333 RepID=U5DED9_AMBTC|nr:hypothetical protein AMTR_s00070p00034470 [Amborella trichopoda]